MSDRGAVTFDARPLTEPVSSREVAAFARANRAANPVSGGTVVWFVIVSVVAGFLVLFVTGMFTMVAIGFAAAGVFDLSVLIVPVIVIAAFVVAVIVLIVVSYRRRGLQRYRISRFAAANNLVYEDAVDNPPLPGMIFGRGSRRASTAVVRGFQPRFVEFANYQYTVSSGNNSTTHRWGYVAVKLDVPLPHIVLDAVGTNALGSNLPAALSKDQRLSLEGDFDRYFHLYCPRGYEADALYLFSPDIMARFIDNAAALDVEIVDDWLFLYMQRPASTTDPATWAWLFGTVGALMSKFEQWARWRDERLRGVQHPSPQIAAPAQALPFAPPTALLTPPPGVAEPGRRLKRRTPWVAVIVTGIVAIVFAIPPLLLMVASIF